MTKKSNHQANGEGEAEQWQSLDQATNVLSEPAKGRRDVGTDIQIARDVILDRDDSGHAAGDPFRALDILLRRHGAAQPYNTGGNLYPDRLETFDL